MAGHSKWANIKNKKSATDAKRSKTFSVMSKLITVAVREGSSGDPNQNPRLRLALDKARAVNMPNVNIDKAIDKGLGKGDGGQIEELLYEGFGPGGVGMIVRILTDNRNRTAAEIKHLFDKHGGSLGGPGSAMYMFERDGEEYRATITIPVDEATGNKVAELIEALEEHDDVEAVFVNLE